MPSDDRATGGADGFDLDDSRALLHRVFVEEPEGVAATVGDVPVCPTCLRAFEASQYGPPVCEDCWQEDLRASGQGGKRYVTEHGEKKHYSPLCPHVRGSIYRMHSDEECVYGRLGPCGTCGPGGRGRRAMTDGGHVGPIIFGNETARTQLVEEGEVITFRATKRTVGDTWWRETRTGPKRGDVVVQEIEGPVTPTMNVLSDYADRSGFESAGAWERAINEVHDSPGHGWLYRVLLR